MEVWKQLSKDRERGARALVAEYSGRLYAAAFQICQNEHDAEDLVQRTLVRVVERISTFNGNGNFFTWMFSILVNFYRMDIRRKAANALVFDDQEVEVVDVRPEPGEQLARVEDAVSVRRAVAILPEPLRLVVVMHYFSGIPVPEIARLLEMPEGTVYFRLHGARKKIREILSKVFRRAGI